jgi:hypothetical protein
MSRHSWLAAVGCLALLVGCASSSSMSRTDETPVIGAGNLRIRQNDAAKVTRFSSPIARVWAVLPSVYDSLSIPLTDLDANKHVIGNSGMKAYKTLGKTSLTRYLDCGKTQGFPSAETYEIQLSVMTQVAPDGDGSTMSTLIEAAGRPLAFAGGFTKCTSTGALETRLADLTNARLQP